MHVFHRPGRRAPRAAALTIALALVLGACARGSNPVTVGSPSAAFAPSPSQTALFPVSLTDDDGVVVTIPSAPQRIVTFAPANTEIVYKLGLGSRLVGVSGSFDNYPAEAASLPKVGGSGGTEPDAEKVVTLRPDLFLATGGGEDWKAHLRQLGITVFTVDAASFADLLHDIRTIGEVTGASQAAGTLTDAMQSTADDVRTKVATEAQVTCFYEVYDPPLYTVGPGSFIFDLLQMAGCLPVTSSAKTSYPQWSVEKLVQEQPQVYLLDSDSTGPAAAVGKRNGFDALSAVSSGRVVVIDSDLVSRPGPRVVDGLLELAKALHPAAFASG